MPSWASTWSQGGAWLSSDATGRLFTENQTNATEEREVLCPHLAWGFKSQSESGNRWGWLRLQDLLVWEEECGYGQWADLITQAWDGVGGRMGARIKFSKGFNTRIQDKAEGGASERWSGGGPPVARRQTSEAVRPGGSVGFTCVLLWTTCWGQCVDHLPFPVGAVHIPAVPSYLGIARLDEDLVFEAGPWPKPVLS